MSKFSTPRRTLSVTAVLQLYLELWISNSTTVVVAAWVAYKRALVSALSSKALLGNERPHEAAIILKPATRCARSCSTGSALRNFSRFLRDYLGDHVPRRHPLRWAMHIPVIYYKLTIYSRVRPNGMLQSKVFFSSRVCILDYASLCFSLKFN